MAGNRRNVTFELPEHVWSKLADDTEQRAMKSHHQRAKQLVIDFYSSDAAEQFEQLAELVRRSTFATLAEAAGKSPEAASAWIRENMPREEQGW